MNNQKDINGSELAEHFFRNEYGKMVSVITRFLGVNNVETAEDIVQETLLKAVGHWPQNGIPENPQAWLYTTAKNITRNLIKRRNLPIHIEASDDNDTLDQYQFSDEEIEDEQLKMMLTCCHPSVTENSQIALMLKILCGFSISEIASAFFSSNETINKRLVRGRKQLREHNISLEIPEDINSHLSIVLKTIYLIFNEGYSPAQKSELIRFDLCLEAIRLLKILANSKAVTDKTECYSMLALMHFNASRFESRMNSDHLVVNLENQERSKWDQGLINQGSQYLQQAMESHSVSKYLILATISANHCIAKSFKETNWKEILSLYDNLLTIEDTATTRLNRAVALAHVQGNKAALHELRKEEIQLQLGDHHLYHATLAEFYSLEKNSALAIEHLKKAMTLTRNERDLKLLEKKLNDAVPIH